MEREFTILIADQNRGVRQFLGREFVAEGYRVLVAESGKELSTIIWRNDELDLLILDDEMAALKECRLHQQLENRIPPLPFIVHSFSPECVDSDLVLASAALVEKRPDIEELKRVVRRVLSNRDPYRANRADARPT